MRVNKYSGLKAKAYKLVRRGIIATTVVATVLVGIGVKNRMDIRSQAVTDRSVDTSSLQKQQSTAKTEENQQSVQEKKMDLELMKQYLTETAMMDDYGVTQFESYVEHVAVTYPGEEIYQIEEALAKYELLPKVSSSHTGDLLKGQLLTGEKLYQQVEKNNKKYEAEYAKTNTLTFPYKTLDQTTLMKICNTISNLINDKVKQGDVNDIEELSCILSELKIFNDPASNNIASINKEITLFYSKENMKNKESLDSFINPDGNADTFTETILHEATHLLQHRCSDNQVEEVINYGISYQFKDLNVNPLNVAWLFESGAEKLKGTDPTNYKNAINYAEGMIAATILRPQNTPTTLYKTSTQHDLNALFEIFQSSSEVSKKEIIKMMFAIDIISDNANYFYDQYARITGEKYVTGAEQESVNDLLRSSIFESYMKQFYLSIANQMKNQSIPIQDLFYLLRVMDANVIYHLHKPSNNYYNFSDSFIAIYENMQDAFFQSIKSNYSKEQLKEFYQNYQPVVQTSGQIYQMYSLSFLNPDKKAFITSQMDRYLNQYQDAPLMTVYHKNSYGTPTKK